MYKKMMERGKRYFSKVKPITRKTLIFILAVFMFITSSSLDVFANPKEKFNSGTKPTLTTTVSVDTSSPGVFQSGDMYILENGASIHVTVTVSSQNLSGYTLGGVHSFVQLGFFDANNNVIDNDIGSGGLKAQVTKDNKNWQDTDYVESQGEIEDPDLTDPNRIYTGNDLLLDFDPTRTFRDDTDYSYEIAVSFNNETMENAVITIKTFVGYDEWLKLNNDTGEYDVIDDNGFVSNDREESRFTIVNSNLKWEATPEVITGKFQNQTAPTLWQQYNYQDVLLTIKNISDKEKPYFDSFEYVFNLQANGGYDGVIDNQMTTWIYNESDPDNPIYNTEGSLPSSYYIGQYNEGGILIYDVTNINYSSSDYSNLYDFKQLGKPIPYKYNSAGSGSIPINETQGGTLYSPSAVAQDPTKKSEMTLLIRIPFSNNFTFPEGNDFVPVTNNYEATVFFGSPQVAVTHKRMTTVQYFRKPKLGASINKEAQKDRMYVGKKGYYSINNVTNTSNLPLFNPKVVDSLPNYFNLTNFEYRIKSTDVADLSKININDVLNSTNPLELELKDTSTGKTRYVPAGLFVEDTSGDTTLERVWKLDGIDALIKSLSASGADEFTGKFRINYAYAFDDYVSNDAKLDVNEIIPGELRVYGLPEKAITIVNNVELYLDYYRYDALSISKDKWIGWTTEPPYTANASKKVEPVEPWIVTQGLIDDGNGNRKEGNPTEGYINSSINGYIVRFGVENSSNMTPGKVTMDVPRGASIPLFYDGFIVKEMTIKADLLAKMDLDKITLTLFDGTQKVYTNAQIQAKKDSNGDVHFSYSEWQAQTYNLKNLVKVEIFFNELKGDTKKLSDLTKDNAYMEYFGTYKYPGKIEMNSKLETLYADGIQQEVAVTSKGELEFEMPNTKNITQAFYDASSRTEATRVSAPMHQNNSGFTYRIGSDNNVKIAPGFFKIDLPANTTAQVHFDAQQLTFTKEMLNRMKLTSITIKATDGTVTILKLSDFGVTYTPDAGSDFMTFTNDLVINKSQWTGVAKEIMIDYEYYAANSTPTATDDAYFEVLGTSYKEGDLKTTSLVSTNYPGGSQNTSSGQATLNIETVGVAINVKSNNDADASINLPAQSGKDITIPIDCDTYYTYDLENKSLLTDIKESKVTINMNNRVRKPSTAIHGFDVERVVIPGDYKDKFTSSGDIVSIVVTDTRIHSSGGNITKNLTMADAQIAYDSNGDIDYYYFDETNWQDDIEYPLEFVFQFEGFKRNIVGANALQIALYGRTDWYTYLPNDNVAYKQRPADWEKLKSTGKFETLNTLANKVSTSEATQNVPVPAVSMSVDYEDYYKEKQGDESKFTFKLEDNDATAYVDGKRSYLATPYEKTLTKRFSLYQPSISTSDTFLSQIDIPLNPTDASTEAGRGFHSEELRIISSIYDGTYFEKFVLTLIDANDKDRKMIVTYKGTNAGKEIFEVIGLDDSIAKIALDPGDDLVFKREYWEAKGIEALGAITIEGNGFVKRNKNVDGDIFLTGFSDSNFADGSNTGGHNDFTRTTSDAYLRNLGILDLVTHKYPYMIRRMDEGRILVSKMYFDLQVETGYTVEGNTKRYEKTGISTENKRVLPSAYDASPAVGTQFFDNDELTVGYKSLTSISVDFRQYLYDYTNQANLVMPNDKTNGHYGDTGSGYVGGYAPGCGSNPKGTYTTNIPNYSRQRPTGEIPLDFDNKSYLKKYAYNTKAQLEITLDIPADGDYEAYYLKIDPRAVIGEQGQKYLQSIKITRKDGTIQTIPVIDLIKNASHWNSQDLDWYRINLLAKDDSELFISEADYKDVTQTNPYYRRPNESMDKTRAVEEIIFVIDINQSESHDNENAAMPDFGSWVEDVNGLEAQHMFEVVGRANTTGTLVPKATAQVTIGDRIINTNGDKNEARIEDGNNIGTTRSSWSLKNYYDRFHRTYWNCSSGHNGYARYTVEYTAGHLSSSSKIIVSEKSSLDAGHGVENSTYYTNANFTSANSKTDYIYGNERPYNTTWFRRAAPAFAVSDLVHEAYIDHAYLTNTLPQLTGDYTTSYDGFRPTEIYIEKDLLKNAKTFTVYRQDGTVLAQYDDSSIIGAGMDLSNKYYIIKIYYWDDPTHNTVTPLSTDISITSTDDYILKTVVEAEGIIGDGDFASETHGLSRNTYFDGKEKDILVKVNGNVNVIHASGVANTVDDGKKDGVSYVNSYVKNDGGSATGTGSYIAQRPARMRSFQIPVRVGSTIDYVGEGSSLTDIWDYEITQNAAGTNVAVNPMLAQYALNFKNEGKTNVSSSDGQKYDESNIETIKFTQPLDKRYRLTQIKIPEELFNGQKFKVSEFTLKIKGTNVDVLKDFTLVNNHYVLDVAAYFAANTTERTVTNYSGVTYASEIVESFTAKYETVAGQGYLLAGEELLSNADDLIFEGIWVDRTENAILNNEWDESENNVPTVGKNAHIYQSPAVSSNNDYVFFNKRADITVTTATFGAKESLDVVVNTSVGHVVKNRVSGLNIDHVRGKDISMKNGTSKKVIAYDDYYDLNGETSVDLQHLLPGDRIDHKITITSSNDMTDVPLKNPVMRFKAPVGTRIVGWDFVDNDYVDSSDVGDTQKIKSAQNLVAEAYVNHTAPNSSAFTMTSGVKYTNLPDPAQSASNYKDLIIRTNSNDDYYLGLNGAYSVIVYLELVNDYSDNLFLGKTVEQEVLLSAEKRHNYDSYYTFTRSNASGSSSEYVYDLPYISGTIYRNTASRANVDTNRDGTNNSLGIRVPTSLTYYKSVNPNIAFTYPKTEKLDKEESYLTVSNIKNDTLHYQETIHMNVSFIKKSTDNPGVDNQYFVLTEIPTIQHPITNNNIDIYYLTYSDAVAGTDNWQLLQANVDLETVAEVRWTYDKVPAFVNNDGTTMVTMADVVFKGRANYRDERTNTNAIQTKNYTTMIGYVSQDYEHIHKNELNMPKEVANVSVGNKNTIEVYRLRPQAEINLQAFDSKTDASAHYVATPSTLKRGYRPAETFYYKLNVLNRSNSTNLGTGKLLKPVVYDKVPTQYVEVKNDLEIQVRDISTGNILETLDSNQLNTPGFITQEKIQSQDIGGAQYLNYISTPEGDAKPTDITNNPTYNPNGLKVDTIEYTVYKYDFSKLNFDLDRGEYLTIVYKVQAKEEGLPLTKWKKADGSTSSAYLPRYGEYGSNSYNYGMTLLMNSAQVKNKMMDMDNLIHEFGLSGEVNENTEPLEFLNGTISHIPGSSVNTKSTGNWNYGSSNGNVVDRTSYFFGANINSNVKQQVTIGTTNTGNNSQNVSDNTVYANYDATKSSNGLTFGNNLTPRSYYKYLMSGRISHSREYNDVDTNIVWSQHNLHMQKAWIYSASETISNTNKNASPNPKNQYYVNGTDLTAKRINSHASSGNYDVHVDYLETNDEVTPAIEYTENFTSRLYATNYGDYGVNGLEYTYVFPKGVKPTVEDASDIKGRLYNGGTTTSYNGVNYGTHNGSIMSEAGSWPALDMDKFDIHYEIVEPGQSQTKSSYTIVDPVRRPVGYVNYSNDDDVDDAWVIKIKVTSKNGTDDVLKKWWNRGTQNEYILALDVPSYVYEDTMSGTWYDRLYVAPTDDAYNSYYDIYDSSHQLSKYYSGARLNSTQYHIDTGGMNDYYRCLHCDSCITRPYSLIAPAGMYLNGYNVHSRKVDGSVENDLILDSLNENITGTDKDRKYAQSGNQATARKPFVRFWGDVGNRDAQGVLKEDQFYADVETETFNVNLNLENRYYAAEYPFGAYYGTGSSRINYSYNLADGGARGTLFDPVMTVVLPYGIMPLNNDGRLFSETRDAIATNGKNGSSDTVSWNIDLSEWKANENGHNQVAKNENVKAPDQNLVKDKFNVHVEFDVDTQRYIVKFIPKDKSNDTETIKLINQQMLKISIESVAYDYATNEPGVALDKTDWGPIEVYLGSSHDVFRYTADDKLSGAKSASNPYQVLARRVVSRTWSDANMYSKFTVDPRYDSVRYIGVDQTRINNANYRGNYLGKTEVRSAADKTKRFPLNGQLSYDEVNLMSATNASLLNSLVKTKNGTSYVDMNWDDDYNFTEEALRTPIVDSGVRNSFVMNSKSATLISELKQGYTKDGAMETDQDLLNPLSYADNIWYSLRLTNRVIDQSEGVYDAESGKYREDASRSGKINHATYTFTQYLPKSLRYDDTYGDSADDKYADYYVEMYDKNNNKTADYSIADLATHGWRVEVKSFPVDAKDPNGPQFIRATLVPPGVAGTDNTNVHQPGKRAPGQLRSGESIVLKIKTRVAEMDAINTDTNWYEKDSSELFVNLHGLDGTEINFSDLKATNPHSRPYSEQSLKTIKFENRLSKEPIRKDDVNDYDQDGVTGGDIPEIYTYDKVGNFSIKQPDWTVRSDTIRTRRLLSSDPITGEIPSLDASFKMAETQELLINQAKLDYGSANQFILQYNVPYRSKFEQTGLVASKPDPRVGVDIKEVSTGVWEVPSNAKYKQELESNARVYVYYKLADDIRTNNNDGTYTTIVDSPIDAANSPWKLLNPNGSTLTANDVLTLNLNNRESVGQFLWVIQHKDDPKRYAIPEGFRLDIDADDTKPGKQEVNDVDPKGLHGDEFVQNVLDNSIKMTMETQMIDNYVNDQFLNFFVSGWAKYTDSKYTGIDKDYRAGYQVTPELPWMDLYTDTKYLRWVGGKYEWHTNTQMDLDRSRIVRHQVDLLNVHQDLIDEYDLPGEEDSITNPNISVALPYREPLSADNFNYVPFDATDGIDNTALSMDYTTTSKADLNRIEANIPWTAYVEDENGQTYPLEERGVTVNLEIKQDPLFSMKPVDNGSDRNVITFKFEGVLAPGQRIIVVYLASVSDGLASSNPADMQTKVYGLKRGNFMAARLPIKVDEGNGIIVEDPSSVAVHSDKYDVNDNGNINELLLELSSHTINFSSNDQVERRKRVSTDLNSTNIESKLPIPVQEGGVYKFTSAIQSSGEVGSQGHMAPVLFDILPYNGDKHITGNAQTNYEVISRNSKWNGWLIPESVEVYTYGIKDKNMSYYKVNPNDYDLLVGPIKYENRTYQLLYDANGDPLFPDSETRSQGSFYRNILTNGAGDTVNYKTEYFVKLSQIQGLKTTNPKQYEELIKGVRAIMVSFKDPAKAVLYGAGRYELKYDMQTPLNLPIYKGDINATTNPDSYKDYAGWNTMASSVIKYDGGGAISGPGVNYLYSDSNEAGIFTDAPSGRGYIGDYVWYDENVDGLQNEAEYNRFINGSRNILSNLTKDFDGDGINDDPGINNVQVELLTKNGYPSNVDGQAVVKNIENDKGGYFVIDEATGNYAQDDYGVKIWTAKGPFVTQTQSDYYGNQGYFIAANLAPGDYKLRYTMPEAYNDYALTTPKVKNKDVEIYNVGDKLPKLNTNFVIEGNDKVVDNLTFMSGVLNVKAVDLSSDAAFKAYDKDAVTADIGVGRPARYGGTVWNDAMDDTSLDSYNGYKENSEDGIADVVIEAVEKGKTTVAIGMDGRPLETTTDANGNYVFDSLWPEREYYFRIKDRTVHGTMYKATPVIPNLNLPLKADEDNDAMNDVKGNSIDIKTAPFKVELKRNSNGIIEIDGNGLVQATTTIDLGLVEPDKGSIGDYVWIDANQNGIQDENELPYTKGLDIEIEAYYFDTEDSEWKELPKGYIEETKYKTKSNEHGSYIFSGLPGIYQVSDGDDYTNYVIGYKVKVPTLPGEYKYTDTRIGDNKAIDSDLRSDRYLTEENEYITLASKVLIPDDNSVEAEIEVNGEKVKQYFSIGSTEFVTDYDIGLIKLEKSTVSGRVFEDANQDGLQDVQDRAVEGVKVYLERLVEADTMIETAPNLESRSALNGTIKVNSEGFIMLNENAKTNIGDTIQEPLISSDGEYQVVSMTTTDSQGKYIFEDVEAYENARFREDEVGQIRPIRYRVRIEKPINSSLTLKDVDQNTSDHIDSDFGIYSKLQPRDVISESFVLGKRMFENEEETDGYGNKYDFTKYTSRGNIDAGLIVYSQYVELGNKVWNDFNQNGLQEKDEGGIEGIEVQLYQFNPDIISKVYVVDKDNVVIGTKEVKGKWEKVVDEEGKAVISKTDKNGEYKFKVLAYDVNPESEHYLEANHYRVVIDYEGDGILSPFQVGTDKTIDSDGYHLTNILGIEVLVLEEEEGEEKPQEPEDNTEETENPEDNDGKEDPETPEENETSGGESLDLVDKLDTIEEGNNEETPSEGEESETPEEPGEEEEKEEIIVPEFDKEGISPFETKVGNIFGIEIGENTIVSEEFVIGKVFGISEELGAVEAIQEMLVKMARGDNSEVIEAAESVDVEGSHEYYDEEETETRRNEEEEEVESKEVYYIDFRSVQSDDTIDFGIKLPEPTKPEPEPEPKPEKPTPEEKPEKVTKAPQEEEQVLEEVYEVEAGPRTDDNTNTRYPMIGLIVSLLIFVAFVPKKKKEQS